PPKHVHAPDILAADVQVVRESRHVAGSHFEEQHGVTRLEAMRLPCARQLALVVGRCPAIRTARDDARLPTPRDAADERDGALVVVDPSDPDLCRSPYA